MAGQIMVKLTMGGPGVCVLLMYEFVQMMCEFAGGHEKYCLKKLFTRDRLPSI